MRLLFLANWPLKKEAKGGDYAFFAQWETRPVLRLMGTYNLGFITRFERFRLRFYVIAPLVAFLRAWRYDAVVAYSSQVGLPLALLFRLAPWRRVKLVIFDVESFGRVQSGLRLALTKFAMKAVDAVVYASSRQIEYYRAVFPELAPRLHHIPIGIGPYPKTQPLGAPATGPIVASGHHGRAFRDWACLLRAYDRVKHRSWLTIVGRTELPPHDRDNVPVPPTVEFRPFLPTDDYKALLEAAPFIVLPLPERRQSLGQLSVLFCMAMGKPVVATRVMGIEDYVADGETGLLVEPGDHEAMAEAMTRLLDNPDEAVAMGRAAFDLLQERFTDKSMGAAWETMMRTVVSASRSR
ncbi:MAG: glycosyltransferase family 4 protein [Deltaproteobacteria bacterium]|nr:glycosyltransferase family 4 protein [Deltaproteobacteria bacterium]